MTTPDECATRLTDLTDGPDLLTKVDAVADTYLVQFRGDTNAIAQARDALIVAVQKLPDFSTKGQVLERLRTGPPNR
jgi:hypothetical protein